MFETAIPTNLGIAMKLMLWALLVLAVTFQPSDSRAYQSPDNPVDQTSPRKTRNIGDLKPKPVSRGSWSVEGFNRVIHIHESDTTESNSAGTYSHRPLFALIESDKPIKGYPSIALNVSLEPDGFVLIDFAASLTTTDFQAIAAAEMLQQDAARLKSSSGVPNKVIVTKWPITHAIVDCRRKRKILSTSETDSLNSINDRIPFSLRFSPEDLNSFLEGVGDDSVSFVFHYTYENRRVASGGITAEAKRSVVTAVKQIVNQKLTEGHRNGTIPLFQHHVNSIRRDASVHVNRVIRAQHKDLLPMIDSLEPLIGKLFDLDNEPTFAEINGDPALNSEVYKSLAPLLEKWQTEDEVVDNQNKENEQTDKEAYKNSIGFGIKIPIGKASIGADGKGSSEISRERRNLLKTEFGVTTKESDSGEYYVPYSIAVYKYNDVAVDALVSESSTAFLGLGSDDSYLEEPPVPASYTLSRLTQLIKEWKPSGPTRVEALKARIADAKMKAKLEAEIAASVQIRHSEAEGRLKVAEGDMAAAKELLNTSAKGLAEIEAEIASLNKQIAGLPKDVIKGNPQGPVRGSLSGRPLPTEPNPAIPPLMEKLRTASARQKALTMEVATQELKLAQSKGEVTKGQEALLLLTKDVDQAQEKSRKANALVEALEAIASEPSVR